MRSAILLMIVALLILAVAWNVNALFDATIAVYQNGAARQFYAVALGLIGAALGVLALVMISRNAHRRIEQDFPETWKDRRG